jgi:hypothetical protein
MKYLHNLITVSVLCALLAFAALFATRGNGWADPPASAGPQVTVVNPITLNPATPNPVTIVNPEAEPVSVTVKNLPGPNPYQRFVTGHVNPSGATFVLESVPAATRRIVQQFSCSTFNELSKVTQARLESVNTGAADFAWQTNVIPFSPGLAFGIAWAKNTLMYFETADAPRLRFVPASPANPGFDVECLVSGYDVRLP